MKKNKLKQSITENRFSFLAFGATAFVMVIVYYCFSVFPFGDYTVLRMDLYHQYGPLFAELYDRVTSGESLIYSWNSGLGTNFLGNFSNYLASPLAIVMLLLGHKNMPEAISLMVLLKAAFASAFFAYYLKKSTKRNDFTIAGFGVLYSFCGFFIAYYWNVMWIDAMALLPLVIYGIEQIINHGKFKTYMFSLAVVMMSNYYMAYIICIFSCIYFLAYYLGKFPLGEKIVVTEYVTDGGERLKAPKASPINRLKNSRFINSGVRFAIASFGAAGLAAFMLMPVYFILQGSSATSGTFPTELKSYFKIFDFLANHLVSLEPTIRSSGEDVLPNVYCGVITAMLVPLYLYSKKYPLREKVSFVVVLGILFASFNTNMLNYIWHGFHFPNDLPYRLSYIYSFILLVMAYKALMSLRDYTPKMLLTVGIFASSFLIFAEKVGSKNVNEDTVYISIIFIVFYTLVMIMIQSNKYQASAVALLLFCGIVAESAVGNTSHYVMQQQKHYYVNDYDEFQQLKAKLDKRENNEFYRMELTDLRTRMDPCWYDYNGVSIFSSMAYEDTSGLIHSLGVDGNVINSYTYNGFQTPVFNMMTSLKYIIDNTTTTPSQSEELFDYVTETETFTVYQNKYNLNIGYCVGKETLGWDYNNNNPFTVQNDYFERATGIPEVFSQLTIDYIDCDNMVDFSSGFDTGELTYFKDINDTEGSFTACYNVTESKNYYIYINSADIDDCIITYGETAYTHNFSSEHIVGLGYIEAGTTVCVNVPIESSNSGYVDIYLSGMDMEKFTKGYDILKAGEMDIKAFGDTHIEGTVTAQEDSLFYTSIPYDESWEITVDGKAISVDEMRECKIGNGFIGFYLTEGEHEISFRYEARGLKIGIIATAATILLMLIFFVLLRKKEKVAKVLKGYSETALIETVVVETPKIDAVTVHELQSNDESCESNQAASDSENSTSEQEISTENSQEAESED